VGVNSYKLHVKFETLKGDKETKVHPITKCMKVTKKPVLLVTQGCTAFGEWADIWFSRRRKNISLTTQDGYRYTLRRLKVQFGERLLSSVKPLEIESLLLLLHEQNPIYKVC
jgi:hypothetical protein